MSDLDCTSSAVENNLGDETDDARLLSDSHVAQEESETSGPSSDDGGADEENVCEAAKSNKRCVAAG